MIGSVPWSRNQNEEGLRVNERNFLLMVKKRGRYDSSGEASRATNAVFGTIKAWLTPTASDRMRRSLPQDASQLWQYSPVASMTAPVNEPRAESRDSRGSLHFVLRVQQLGRYGSSDEAHRATRSVIKAMARSIPADPVSFLGLGLPSDILGAEKSKGVGRVEGAVLSGGG